MKAAEEHLLIFERHFSAEKRCRPPTDVDAFPKGASPFGVMDMVGNV